MQRQPHPELFIAWYNSGGTQTQQDVVSYTYDNRRRLLTETCVRDGTTTVYDYEYTYDQLGNRLSKEETVGDVKSCYIYDYQWDPDNDRWDTGLCWTPPDVDDDYETLNNRLLWQVDYVDDAGGWVAARTIQYTYYKIGHVSNITVRVADEDVVQDLALYYTTDGKLWRALWDEWEEDEYGDYVTDTYEKHAAREFYYDGPRQRYLTRDVDPDTWEPDTSESSHWPQLWTDYAGVMPYGDFGFSSSEVVSEEMKYLSGAGLHAIQELDGQNDPISYLHGDLVDSTMVLTDESGDAVSGATLSYTAFGEPLSSIPTSFPRYQYGGGWGYEADFLALEGENDTLPPITLQHVGWRWYQPDTGRFIMRDPIGIDGGLNLYAYCGNNPLAAVDPMGLEWCETGPAWASAIINVSGGVSGSNGWSGFWDDDNEIVNASNAAVAAGAVGLGAAAGAGVLCVLPAAGAGAAAGAAAPSGYTTVGEYVYLGSKLFGKIIAEHGGVVGEGFKVVTVKLVQGGTKIISVPF